MRQTNLFLLKYVNNTYILSLLYVLIEFRIVLHDIFMNKSNKTNALKTNLFMTCIKMSHILLSFHKLHVKTLCHDSSDMYPHFCLRQPHAQLMNKVL